MGLGQVFYESHENQVIPSQVKRSCLNSHRSVDPNQSNYRFQAFAIKQVKQLQ